MNGYTRIHRLRIFGAPVYVHWSNFVLGGIIIATFLQKPLQGLTFALSYIGIILLHECGHAYVARRLGYQAYGIYLGLLHGCCTYDQPYYAREDYIIAWGGVIAQLVVALPLVLLNQIPGMAHQPLIGSIIHSMGYFSIGIAIYNLIPIHGFDGEKAWRLLPFLLTEKKEKATAKKATKNFLRRIK